MGWYSWADVPAERTEARRNARLGVACPGHAPDPDVVPPIDTASVLSDLGLLYACAGLALVHASRPAHWPMPARQVVQGAPGCHVWVGCGWAGPRMATQAYLGVGRPAGVKRPCPGEKPHLASNAIKLLTHLIWAPACQRHLVGLASLMTHKPGHTIRAGLWLSSQRDFPRLQDGLSDLRFGGARTGPPIVPIGTHFQDMSSQCACSEMTRSHHT